MTFNQPAINGIFSPPPPTREAGLARLAAFVPQAGRAYAVGRNTDPGPGAPSAVSGLSPYLRHRLVRETEVISAVIARHGAGGAEKFIQEVFWRIYWKGWLELRPALWSSYRQRLAALREDAALMLRAEQAMRGETGIGCFDAWARELAQTGTLHNHTRMWFASIWCFTLKLPWLLGADFFFQHLLDADAASNLLSWRWVAGCQTPNKPYIARAANIAHYTNGRFAPYGVLNEAPEPVAEPNPPAMQTLPAIDDLPRGKLALLLHEDDLGAGGLALAGMNIVALGGLAPAAARAFGPVSEQAAGWTRAALAGSLSQASRAYGLAAPVLAPDALAAWARDAGAEAVITPYAPVGWTADALRAAEAKLHGAGLRLYRLRRAFDARCWPLARRGFFDFKAHIPALLKEVP